MAGRDALGLWSGGERPSAGAALEPAGRQTVDGDPLVTPICAVINGSDRITISNALRSAFI